MHPLAISNSKSGFTDSLGNHVVTGDRVTYIIDGRKGVLDEAMHDGDAFVTWEDGSFGEVKWRNLSAAPKAPEEKT